LGKNTFIAQTKFDMDLLPLGLGKQISLQKSKIIFPNPKGSDLDFRKYKRSLKVEKMELFIFGKNILIAQNSGI